MERERIAELELVAVRETGERTPFTLTIAAPAREATGEWSCALSLEGLHDGLAAMRGEDALQALCLALGLGASLLRGFVSDGGLIEYAAGDAFPLEAYFGWSGSFSSLDG